jgi:YD repeat-containing protein
MSVLYYFDDKARVVQHRASTHLGGVEKDWFLYDFVENATKHKTEHKPGSGTSLTETLTYNTGTHPRWGGDVNKISWKDNRAAQLKTYALSYDTVGRLTTATFNDAAGSSINFAENVTAYDANGNITGLQRYGRTSASAYGLIDNLAYTYSGNKVTSIKDTGSAAYSSDFRYSNVTNNTYTYTYDASGRMTKDTSKGITSITWNVLGLPQTVTFSGGAVINYSYAADGTKLRESRTASGTTTTTDYTGNLVLEDGERMRLLFDGGYMSLSDNAYHYFLTDHLGSVRVVASSADAAEEHVFITFNKQTNNAGT